MDDARQPIPTASEHDSSAIPFPNRSVAGRLLAAELEPWRALQPIVIAISNGGLPVGCEIARRLDAELDVVSARRLRPVGQPSLTLGAVLADGTAALNRELVAEFGLASPCLDEMISVETTEACYEALRFRRGLPPIQVAGRIVIVVDDAIVTGATMLAAVRSLHARRPHQIVVAVPVSAAASASAIAREVDALICLRQSSPRLALFEQYRDFERVSPEAAEIMLCEYRIARDSSHRWRAHAP